MYIHIHVRCLRMREFQGTTEFFPYINFNTCTIEVRPFMLTYGKAGI